MKSWKRIPTYEECLEMCRIHGNMVFYMTERFVQGYKIQIFSYRYATPEQFMNPIEGVDVTAHDLRGLTFVFNEDNTIFKTFVGLPKFWNINQVGESQYELIKDGTINSVYDKRDGSMVTFIMLPNGNIIPKTKGSVMGEKNCYMYFDDIMEVYNNDENLQKFIELSLKNFVTPIFEFTSYDNKIVLRYDKSELTLLRVRDNITGIFYDIDKISKIHNVKISEKCENRTLEEYMELAKTKEDIEGWVFDIDGVLYKQKTQWYFDRHHINTEEVGQPNRLACMIIDETIDDVIGLLDPVQDKKRIDQIDEISEKIFDYALMKSKDVLKEFKEVFVGKCNRDRREYALNYRHESENFAFVMMYADEKDIIDCVLEALRKEIYHLKKCESFLEKGYY